MSLYDYSSPRRRGFNLIEAAIVLGVVGLVIGGIWIAAAAVNEGKKINDTVNGMQYVAQHFRNAYKGIAPSDIPDGNTTLTLSQYMQPPPGYSTNAAGDLIDPYGQIMYLSLGADSTTGSMYSYNLTFSYRNKTTSFCVKLGSALAKTKTVYMIYNSGSSYYNMFGSGGNPLTVDNLQNIVCLGNRTDITYFLYSVWP